MSWLCIEEKAVVAAAVVPSLVSFLVFEKCSVRVPKSRRKSVDVM